MGCGDIGEKLVEEGVKYGLEVGVEKLAEAAGLPKPFAKGIATIFRLWIDD